MTNGRAKLFGVQGGLMVIIVSGYVGLTFYSLVRWNEAISAALVTGFVLFAQSSTRGFFDWLEAQPPGDAQLTETKTTTETKVETPPKTEPKP